MDFHLSHWQFVQRIACIIDTFMHAIEIHSLRGPFAERVFMTTHRIWYVTCLTLRMHETEKYEKCHTRQWRTWRHEQNMSKWINWMNVNGFIEMCMSAWEMINHLTGKKKPNDMLPLLVIHFEFLITIWVITDFKRSISGHSCDGIEF